MKTTTLNDEQLIQNYLTASPDHCFEILYTRYVSKVYKQCYELTKDAHQAQDFTQDIFIKLFPQLGSFQHRSTFSTWLHSISFNYCMTQRRVLSRTETTTLTDTLNGLASDNDEAELAEYRLQQLAQAMDLIAPKDAMILRLKYQDGLEVKQIARQLNLKESAVKMRLKRSRERVRQLCLTNTL